MNQLPTIVPKATRPTPTNHRPTVKAQNRTPVLPSAKPMNYSNYKHNTAKGLIGISPSSAVTFVSDLYVGRSSYKQITNDCGIFNFSERGDSVMADKRFDVETDLPVGESLNVPPFLCGKQQLSIQEDTETRRITSVRIHVEQAIAMIKNYRIPSIVFPINMAADLNKIWVLSCRLSIFFASTNCGKI